MTRTPGIPFWSTPSRAARVRPRLPRLVGTVRADVCVVGLGGAGLSALARLVEAGRRVVGVDARGVAAGAAGRNGGFVLAGPAELHHQLADRVGRDLARRLYELTVEGRDRILAEAPEADPRGSLRLPATIEEHTRLRQELEALVKDGFEARWLEPASERRLDPGDGPAGGRAGARSLADTSASGGTDLEGLLVPGDGVLDPVLRCTALADRVADRAELFGDSPVVEIGPERVRCPTGDIRAEVVLVAVDGGLDRLLPPLSGRVRSVRLQMLATGPAADVEVPYAIYYREGYDYWHQRGDGCILLGGARDLGGEAEETDALGITAKVQGALEARLRDLIMTRAPVTHRWSGIVGYSSDDLPIAGEVSELGAGVFAAGGYSGTGNVLGSLAGEAIADLALGRRTPALVEVLSAARAELSRRYRSR